MLNLYWKIFLAFWLTTLLMLGAAFWLSSYLPVNKNFEPGPPPRVLARKARNLLHRGEFKQFQLWAAQLESAHNVEVFLFDKAGALTFNTTASPFSMAEWPLLISELEQARRHSLVRKGRHYFLASRSRRSADRRTQRLNRVREREPFAAQIVFSTPSARGEFARLFIRNAGIRFGIAVIISGLICYWLARYFTVPIRRLRSAMKTVADGDYSVRTAQHTETSNDELGLLAQDFDRMTEKVEQTLSSQARLIKDVSHELRSPLARLQASLGLAQQKLLSSQTTEVKTFDIDTELQKIDDEVQVIDELVEQILSLPQRDLPLPDTVDLLGVIEHCVANAQENTNTIAIEFSSDVEEALVATNGRLLLSVFDNIIANAMRYSPSKSKVIVHLSKQNKAFLVTLTDSGPGVNPEQLAHLFEPFYRASDARERHTGGHGLGLAIAERNVLLHKGRIQAANRQPNGLQVQLVLPEKQ